MANLALDEVDDLTAPILEDPKDGGKIGFLVIVCILIIGAVALTAGVMIYRQRYNACRYNTSPYCPVLQCSDGTNPVANAQTAVKDIDSS